MPACARSSPARCTCWAATSPARSSATRSRRASPTCRRASARTLYPTLSIFENIDFFGRLFGQSKDEREWRIEDLSASTDLTAFREPAGELFAGGMKQKLGLCSLIHDPDLLILDEPTTGVDPLARRQFWELIDRIRVVRPGMSVLVATAYMDEPSASTGWWR